MRNDPRLRNVPWSDLLSLRRHEIAHELTLSLPWLLASLAAAHWRLYPLALLASFMFFLTGLRQVHNAYHYALGVPRAATEWVMLALSVLMLGSMHAVQVNHLRHHRYCLGEEDVEAMSARLPAWRALLLGPWFPLRLHHAALQVGSPRQRRWIGVELLANAVWIALVFAFLDNRVLQYHVMAMALGQCLTAFFAVWTVHHDCSDGAFPARTIRNPLKARLTYAMFYHVEHHLYPAVPTRRLPILARRLDRVAPDLGALKVF
ncbi:MAG: fatty acid desaturase [Betaproteobacteria bacterium 13_1_20CM_3_63_8]|nr:MAG: fatty acid desaturase [Betaproteobacteria bacterium 13_1_20CM_3_63_8]